jgi:hypothetical protein
VFILKGVKVICFDTLLQVLILKVVRGVAESLLIGVPVCPYDHVKTLAKAARLRGAVYAGSDP